MKETGIIMSGDHPRKILDGTKTMTRRTWGLEKINEDPGLWIDPFYDEVTGYWNFWQVNTGDVLSARCPYGHIGDLLWVRESYAIRADGVDQILYKADYDSIVEMLELDEFVKRMGYPPLSIKWKPSIHMFRKDSRIEREITGLRAERLQEITEEDALAEGCTMMAGVTAGGNMGLASARYSIMQLWDSLNTKRGYGWDFNPWVWPISF